MDKTCNNCKDSFPLSKFGPLAGGRDGLRGDCKKCYSLGQSIRSITKRANKNPKNFMMCNNCDRTFSKVRGGKGQYAKPVLMSACKFCGSTDIEEYYQGEE